MSVFSNSGSSVFWSNPDSNFNFNATGFGGGYGGSPIMPNRNNNMPFPLVSDSNNIGVSGIGLGGIGLGGIGLGGIGLGGIGLGGIGLGMPFMGGVFF